MSPLRLVTPAEPAPEHVAILGLGPSIDDYSHITRRLGDRRALCDETWGINAAGAVFECDRVFHMDDFLIQMRRVEARPQSSIANMLDWLRRYDRPIYTPRLHPDFPSAVEYPLEAVINSLGFAYFNGTAAYALAYAVHIGVKTISLFGCDYTYANRHDAEKGRACLECHVGAALARGINVRVSRMSSLIDMCDGQPFYGYGRFGSRDATLSIGEDGRAKIALAERAELPTADEIEAEYDHSQPAAPLVSRAAEERRSA